MTRGVWRTGRILHGYHCHQIGQPCHRFSIHAQPWGIYQGSSASSEWYGPGGSGHQILSIPLLRVENCDLHWQYFGRFTSC